MRQHGVVRGMAEAVSRFTVRHAAGERREWAAGMAREVEEVPGDWAALGWALGSMRVLLEGRRMLSPGLAAPPSYIQSVFRIVMTLQFLNCAIDAVQATDWVRRVGWALAALGWMYWEGTVVRWMDEAREVPDRSDRAAMRVYLREQMERRLARYRSAWRWVPPMITVGMCAGYVVTLKGGVAARPWTAVTFAAVGGMALVLQLMETPAAIEARIRRLEALVGED